MIFALSTDDGSLYVFADTAAAIAQCEGIDVEEGGWRFWGSIGEPLEAVFTSPNVHTRWSVGSGVYVLQPGTGGVTLRASLDQVRILETNPHFVSLAALRDHMSNVCAVEPSNG